MDKKEKNNVIEVIDPLLKARIEHEVEGLKFTKISDQPLLKNGMFLPGFKDTKTGGAAGKVIIHYNLYGNRDVFINTTIIFDDPELYVSELHPLVYALGDEIVNRLVGYADTLLSVHAGENSYQAEYVSP